MSRFMVLTMFVLALFLQGSLSATTFPSYELCAPSCAYPKCCLLMSETSGGYGCYNGASYPTWYTSLNVTNRRCMLCTGTNKTFIPTAAWIGNETLGGNCPYSCNATGMYNSTLTSQCLCAEPGWYSPANDNGKYRCSQYPLNYSCIFTTSCWSTPDCPISCLTYTSTLTESISPSITPTITKTPTLSTSRTASPSFSPTAIFGPSIVALIHQPLYTRPEEVAFGSSAGILSPDDKVCWVLHGTSCRACVDVAEVGISALSQRPVVILNFTLAANIDICYFFDAYGLWSFAGNFTVLPSFTLDVEYPFPCDLMNLTINGRNFTKYALNPSSIPCGSVNGLSVDPNAFYEFSVSFQALAPDEGRNIVCIQDAISGMWDAVGFPFRVYTPIFPITGLAPMVANDLDYDVKGMCQNGIEVCRDIDTTFGQRSTCYCICFPGFCGRFCCKGC